MPFVFKDLDIIAPDFLGKVLEEKLGYPFRYSDGLHSATNRKGGSMAALPVHMQSFARLSESGLERLDSLFPGLDLLLLGGFFILTTDNHANLKRPDFCR